MEPPHPNSKGNHISKRVRVRVPGRRQRRNYYCLGCNVQFRVNSEGCKMQRREVDCEGETRLSVKPISPGSRHRRWACLICKKNQDIPLTTNFNCLLLDGCSRYTLNVASLPFKRKALCATSTAKCGYQLESFGGLVERNLSH